MGNTDKLTKQATMLAALTRAQSTFITQNRPKEAFEQLLEVLLSVTESEYGFIGEVMYDDNDKPYLKAFAITDISWDEATRKFYAENAPAGLEFTNTDSLFGHVMTSGKPVIANNPKEDPRRAGIPSGHPPLNAFLGLPFFQKDELLGMVGVANRHGGYDKELTEFLTPLLSTCAHLIRGRRLEQEREHSRKREAELMQGLENAHRAEALGRLAGGIAHDFNNLLTIIGCSCELIAAGAPVDTEVAADAAAILLATERGKLLANQLLSFARSGELNPEVTSFNNRISEALRMLRRLLGSDIELIITLSDDAGAIWMDPVSLEHIVINLGVNARDAMPNGGKLHVDTQLIEAGGKRFAELSMRDMGTGIDEKTHAKIFDPFFTTKAPGKGTGLGLAMCQGAVRSANGTIDVTSVEGEGTTFTVRIPSHDGEVPPDEKIDTVELKAPEAMRILLAEDEPRLREIAERILVSAGYEVVAVSDGFEAQRVAELQPGSFQVLLTDVIMPGLGGYELAQRLRETIPTIIFMSGYMGVLEPSSATSTWPVLSKPFTARQLLLKISDSIKANTASRSR